MHFDFNEYSGLKYFWQNLLVMWSTCTTPTRVVIVAYFFLLGYVCIKGTKKEKLFFVVSLIVLLIGCFNPWMAWYLAAKWGFMERYFRLFWIIPVSIGFTHYGMKLYDSISSKKKKIILWSALVLFLGYSSYLVCKQTKYDDIYTGAKDNTGMVMVDNIYKVEDEIVEVSEIIEKDSGNPYQSKMGLYNRDVALELRTYDASILPVANYGTLGDFDFNTALSESNWWGLMAIFFKGKTDGVDSTLVTTDLMKTTMSNINCDYVILPNDNTYYETWTAAFENLGIAGRYTVLKTR